MKPAPFALALTLIAANALAGPTALDASFATAGRANFTVGAYYKSTVAHLYRPGGGSVVLLAFSDVDGSNNPVGPYTLGYYPYSSAGAAQPGQAVPVYVQFARIADAVMDSMGRVVIVGSTSISGSGSDFRIARLLPTGQPDTSFGGDGMVDIDFAAGGLNDDHANAVSIDDQDRVVVVGEVERAATGDFDFGSARLTSTGALDTTFNGTGRRITHFDLGPTIPFDSARAVAIDSAGRITLAGGAYDAARGVTRIALARLTGTGLADVSFCPTSCNYMDTYTAINNGRSVIFYGNATPALSDQVATIAINGDGVLLIAGTTPGSGETLGFIQRFDTSGNWVAETTTQGGAGGQMFIGGLHWTQSGSTNSDLILTGASGPSADLFFAQRFDAQLFAKANWGIVGPSNSVYIWSASGGFGDIGGNRPAQSTMDPDGRVLVGGRFRASAPSNPYSATASRLTSTDAQPAAIEIFKNSFE
ncbi:MAG: hypothetical protein IPH50_08240 [Rhodanobacteraceae bacterium]|nr:hypothetical protein [Rhodanobacteraceae bacterium]